jgi:predicted exporter
MAEALVLALLVAGFLAVLRLSSWLMRRNDDDVSEIDQ